MSENAETAILAGGRFWIVQELVRHRDRVISTRGGYTGGKNHNPTDADPPGHADAVEIVFDPERISCRELLEFFSRSIAPTLAKMSSARATARRSPSRATSSAKSLRTQSPAPTPQTSGPTGS